MLVHERLPFSPALQAVVWTDANEKQSRWQVLYHIFNELSREPASQYDFARLNSSEHFALRPLACRSARFRSKKTWSGRASQAVWSEATDYAVRRSSFSASSS